MNDAQPLTQADVDALTEPERLGLMVAAAYGTALAERDQARDLLADALVLVDDLLAAWPESTWAADSFRKASLEDRRANLVQAIEAAQAVDSDETPAAQKD